VPQKKTPRLTEVLLLQFCLRLAALDGKETVAWVFVYYEASWKLAAFWALVLAEVVDSLLFTTAKNNVL
jgi:hypothetical protein